MTINEFAIAGIKRGQMFVHMFVDDLQPSEWTHVACPGANAPVWIVGHLAVSAYGLLGFVTQNRPVTPDESLIAKYKGGSHYDADICTEKPAELLKHFDAITDSAIKIVGTLTPENFSRKIEHPRLANVGDAISIIGAHPVLHSGQLSIIRRTLGKPAVF